MVIDSRRWNARWQRDVDWKAGGWLVGLAVLAWLLTILSLPLIGLGLGATGLVLLLVRWPWLLWLGLAMLLPVSSGIKLGLMSATEVILLLAVGFWFADGVRRRRLHLYPVQPAAWMALYLGALTLSLFQAIDWREAIAELLKWVEFILVLLLVREVLPPARIPWLVAALLFGASAQAVLGLYQFIFRIGPDWFIVLGRFMRASGSFRQPNPFAGYMGLTLPVAFSLAWWAWGNVASGWRSREDRRLEAGGGALNKPSSRLLRIEDWPTAPRKKIWCWVIFYSAVTGLLALGLLASWSRGGWLGAAAGLTVVLLMHSRRASWLAVLGMLLVLSLALMDSFTPTLLPTALRARLQDIPTFLRLTDVLSQPVTDDNFSVVERVAHWAAALRMWEQAPWLGVGPGNYAVVYPTVRLPRWEEALGHAHNIYLNVLGENGLVGLAAYLLTWSGIVAWVWRRHRHWQASGASWRTAVAIGLLGVLAHLSVHHFFDNLFVQGLYLQVALWLALIESDMRR